jgi:hypothetical protein
MTETHENAETVEQPTEPTAVPQEEQAPEETPIEPLDEGQYITITTAYGAIACVDASTISSVEWDEANGWYRVFTTAKREYALTTQEWKRHRALFNVFTFDHVVLAQHDVIKEACANAAEKTAAVAGAAGRKAAEVGSNAAEKVAKWLRQ